MAVTITTLQSRLSNITRDIECQSYPLMSCHIMSYNDLNWPPLLMSSVDWILLRLCAQFGKNIIYKLVFSSGLAAAQ